MNENTDNGTGTSRVMRSAKVLKAYFEHKLHLKLELLMEAPAEPLSHGLQFDLQISRWGIWGMSSSAPLSEKTQSEISAQFHNLLGAFDDTEKRRHDLLRLQAKYEAVWSNLPPNVIPLRRPPTVTRAREGFKTVRDRRWALKQDCLLESSSASDIHMMALEIHGHSGRVAFMDYRDLNNGIRKSLTELISLGAITLFIPNLLDLTREEQEVLHALTSTVGDDRPLLMVGAHKSYSDLRGEPAVQLEFLLRLSRAYIKLTRPFAEYRDKGLIHYFLDSLAQNPS